MYAKLAKIGMLVFICAGFVQTVFAADKDKYRPYQHHYPQIIHESDYPTIEAIGNVVTELQSLPKGAISCSYDNGVVSLQSAGDIADISTYDREVMVGERHYREKHTLVYFNTLIKMVGDLTKSSACRVKFAQFPTHDYKTREVIDFRFGKQVVEMDSLSNGRDNTRHYYTLDLLHAKNAYFKGRY